MSDKKTVFETLSEINVNEKTEKKGGFTYLSWAWAWGTLVKHYPEAEVTVYHNEVTNMPYFGAGKAGAIVKVGVTVEGLERISYLPCMDFKNKAIPEENINMMDVNKAIQRATVKAIGLHGLGLYIYAGEDLPEGDEKESPVKKKETAKSGAAKSPVKSTSKPAKPKAGNFRKSARTDEGL